MKRLEPFQVNACWRRKVDLMPSIFFHILHCVKIILKPTKEATNLPVLLGFYQCCLNSWNNCLRYQFNGGKGQLFSVHKGDKGSLLVFFIIPLSLFIHSVLSCHQLFQYIWPSAPAVEAPLWKQIMMTYFAGVYSAIFFGQHRINRMFVEIVILSNSCINFELRCKKRSKSERGILDRC